MGTRLDVTPEPCQREQDWARPVFGEKAFWKVRDANASTGEITPLSYWYKQVGRDYNWTYDIRVSNAAPTSEEHVAGYPTPLWAHIKLGVISPKSSSSKGLETALKELDFTHPYRRNDVIRCMDC